MPFIIRSPLPIRGPSIVDLAFAGLAAQNKAEARAAKKTPDEPAVAHPKGEKAKPGKGTPNKAEAQWMDRITRLGCIACLIDGHPGTPGAVHHIVEGNRRLGHLFTIALCQPGHHMDGQSVGKISRHPHKARFEQQYGMERDLLERTKKELKRCKL